MTNADGDIKWHSAFFSAIQLELSDYKNSLEFTDEYQLSKEALRMDVLIVKKNKNVDIKKNIGKIFRGHNIVEFKSEEDYISINDFYKVCGYAFLYKSFEGVNIDDVTITFVETKHPRDLLKHLKEKRCLKLTEKFDGIYYIEGDVFQMQIIESKKLSKRDNLWIRSLRSNLNADDMLAILKKFQKQGEFDLNNAYLSTVMEANSGILKEVLNMSVAELEIILKEAALKKGWISTAEREAEERKAIEVAKAMLLEGDSIDKVVRITKLPFEKIRLLKM